MTPAKRNDPECPHMGSCPETMVSWQKYVDSRLTAIEKAAEATAQSLRERLDGINHLHEQIREQRADTERRLGEYVQNTYYQTGHEQIRADIRDLRESRAALEGKTAAKASMSAVLWSYLLGGSAVLVALIDLIYGILKK